MSGKPISLRIELQDVKPLVWRRIVVSEQSTLASLHGNLQWVMGWQDTHAHEFHVAGEIIAPQWWIQESAADRDDVTYKDERRVSVATVASQLGLGGEFEYLYDMGDDWSHRIVIEETPTAWITHDLPMPMCTAGENACPPDDVGGPPGYEHFLESLSDSRSEEHADMLQWIGGVFDPRGFDLNRINRDWPRAKRRR